MKNKAESLTVDKKQFSAALRALLNSPAIPLRAIPPKRSKPKNAAAYPGPKSPK
jgi:hypothetical protein